MESLEEKAELLDLLLAATHDGVVDWDFLDQQTRYNDRWRFLLGWDEDDFVLGPNTWRELIHEDERPAVERALSEHLESGWPFNQIARVRHRSLGWRWILMRGMVKRGANGEPSRMVITFADIDERVRAETQLRAMLAAIPDTILKVRLDGSVVDAKEGAPWGRPSREGEAQALFAAIRASDAGPRVMESIKTAVRLNEVVQIPCHLHGSTEGPKDYDLRIVRSGADETVCIVRDVSREKSSEEQLARGRKLEAIGQLAAGLAHEINTPLQYIGDNLGFVKDAVPSLLSLIDDFHRLMGDGLSADALAQIAHKEEEIDLLYLQDSLEKALLRALEGLDAIGRIVQAMKTFENAGRQDRAWVDLNPIVENATIVASRAWNQFLDLAIQLAPDLPQIPCIPGEIAQVVMNLVVNAAQAIADKVGKSGKKGQITVETLHMPTDEAVQIRVTDDGIGIPEAIRGKIFDPFFTTRPPGHGSGQGLAQVHATVTRHGGCVDFESREGQGTTFVVRLPTRDRLIRTA